MSDDKKDEARPFIQDDDPANMIAIHAARRRGAYPAYLAGGSVIIPPQNPSYHPAPFVHSGVFGPPLSASVSGASITVTSLIIPERKTAEGILVRSTSAIWSEIVRRLGSDWSAAFQLTPDQWEELIAGVFHRDGYDEVTKTPRSGDHGRDVIAVKHGFGSVRILGSVKAYKPDHLVEYDAVRALIGVVTADQKASKGIVTTTSDFPPLMENDPGIAPFLPTRLELVNGKRLQEWLKALSKD
jgi:restriction system protein